MGQPSLPDLYLQMEELINKAILGENHKDDQCPQGLDKSFCLGAE
jgi:hypothetical protein